MGNALLILDGIDRATNIRVRMVRLITLFIVNAVRVGLNILDVARADLSLLKASWTNLNILKATRADVRVPKGESVLGIHFKIRCYEYMAAPTCKPELLIKITIL